MRLATDVVVKFIAIAVFSLGLHAQPHTPAFEVASIRPATPLGPLGRRADRTGGPGTRDTGMYSCRNCPISWVLAEAYDLQPFEWVAPEWMQDARFDFLAKVPPGTAKAELRIMLQTLLADRFKLTVHRETKEMPVYELTIARSGLKFGESLPQPASRDVAGAAGQPDKDGFPVLTKEMSMAILPGHARMRSDNQPISWFVRLLSAQLQSPVIDATQLKGTYAFVLSWRFEENDGAAAMLDPFRPALINAVQSQLGLKLEQKKGRAEVLIVDRIEKQPSAN
jgi:uncharacterized protein (TIGR03435 family)